MSWSEQQIAKAIEMERAGHSGTEIGRAIGKSRNAVIGKLLRMKEANDPRMQGVGQRFKRAFSDEQSLFILDRHENYRESFPKIAKRLGVASSRVEEHNREIMKDLAESEAG